MILSAYSVSLCLFIDHPKITVNPSSETKAEGDNLTLTCNVTGNPVPTISWTRDGSPLDRNHNSRISFSADKKQMTVTNVSRRDSGEYRCVASNSLGNDTSNASSVDIQCKYNVLLSQKNRSKTDIEVVKVRHTLKIFANFISFFTKKIATSLIIVVTRLSFLYKTRVEINQSLAKQPLP